MSLERTGGGVRWRDADELIKWGLAEGDGEGSRRAERRVTAVLWMEWSDREKEEHKGEKEGDRSSRRKQQELSREYLRTGRSLRQAVAHCGSTVAGP